MEAADSAIQKLKNVLIDVSAGDRSIVSSRPAAVAAALPLGST
jgi:hypothetical protein